jgi:hypothetical protein
MSVAFDGIGGLPMRKIRKIRDANKLDVERMIKERESFHQK